MKYIYLNIFLLFTVIVNLNCGVYGFRGNNPPEGINTLAVPEFQDLSGFSDPSLSDNFTQILKTNIISDNTFRIADRKISDGILKCTIKTVKDEALVIASGENVTKRKLTIYVEVIFENLKTQKLIWNRTFENYGEYDSSGDSFSERNTGINIAVGKICDDIIIDLTSDW